jgi:hypothetical protein
LWVAAVRGVPRLGILACRSLHSPRIGPWIGRGRRIGCCGWVGGGGCRMLLRVVAHWRLRVAWLRRVHRAIRERGGGSRRRCALLQHVSADLCRTYNVNTWPRNAEAKGSIDRRSSVGATRADGSAVGVRRHLRNLARLDVGSAELQKRLVVTRSRSACESTTDDGSGAPRHSERKGPNVIRACVRA